MLKRITIGMVTLIFLLLNFSSSNASYQNEAKRPDTDFDNKDGLKLLIELNKTTYNIADDPALKVSLKNISQKPITLYKDMGWGVASSLFLAIGDSNGQLVRGHVLSDAQDYPPFPEKDFITLQPNEEFSFWRRFDMEGQGITKVGEYSITVWYHSPVSKEHAPQSRNVWTKEKGTLRSKPFVFTVTR
jgi:hypothetical protein